MTLDVSRRRFMKLAGAGAAGAAIGTLGFTAAEAMVAAHVRPFKLAKATEMRNTCWRHHRLWLRDQVKDPSQIIKEPSRANQEQKLEPAQ